MTTFFTSDTHFSHKNIMKFCPATRPYQSVKEMNEHLIESWNSVVGPDDVIHHLGDFTFSHDKYEIDMLFKALNGKKILYIGNHDGEKVQRLAWESVSYGAVLKIDGVKVHINHHPFVAGKWDAAHHGTYHLFGHVHGEPVYDVPVRALDVGVDNIGPVPWSWEQVHEKLSKVPVVVKHHD
jgi:calcineurin-like phosphoesterase family protein